MMPLFVVARPLGRSLERPVALPLPVALISIRGGS